MMNKKSRRNILKGLAVTTPAVWASPVVESVVLPSHAQTSGSDNSDDICPTLTISGFTVDCATLLPLENRLWTIIDDADGCGQFTTGDPVVTTASPGTPATNQFHVQVRVLGSGRVLFLATNTHNSTALWVNSYTCPTSNSIPAQPILFTSTVTTPGGGA
jgi:hypothetical protein